MPLPDATRLRSLPAEAWGALGRRLRAVCLTATAAVPYAKLAALSSDPRQGAMAKWHLRRVPTPSALAMRMLMFWDPITPDEARTVLGDELPLERLLDAGLLARDGGGVVSAFVLQLLAGLYVLSDDVRAGGDAVMGAGPSTKSLAAAAQPLARAGRALDLGCGAGTLALGMASKCDHVVATDVSERAVELARANAALNGLTNIECRVGDLFDPVLGESFDLVVSQPPFIARDETDEPAAFLFGGPRGDELAMRILGGLSARLAANATAFVIAEWPIVEGERALDERIVTTLGSPDLSVLLLEANAGDLDAHCARYASLTLDGEYERVAMRRRDHLERLRIHALQPALVVARRVAAELAWASTVHNGSTPVSRARVEAMFAARDLLSRGRESLLAARVRVRGEANVPKSELLTTVDASDSVGAAIASHATATGRSVADVAAEILAQVTEALLAGHLEVNAR